MELKKLPQIKIWADVPLRFDKTKAFKGKFVMTKTGKFFAKLFPKDEWDGSSFFHNMVLEEVGMTNVESAAFKQKVEGGGKIEVELIDDYVEVRLYGKSTIYGYYKSEEVDTGELEEEVRVKFELMDLPILVIPDVEG